VPSFSIRSRYVKRVCDGEDAFRSRDQVGLARKLRFVILDSVQAPANLGPFQRASSRSVLTRRAGWGRVSGHVSAVFGLGIGLLGCSDAAPFGTHRAQPGDHGVNPQPTDEPQPSSDVPTIAPTSQPPAPAPSDDELGDPFEEEQCPDVPQRVERSECDPLGAPEQCPTNQGCYPYVHYPTSRCEPERFGTRCDTAGPGQQGDHCSGQRCAHGYLCVVTGRGTECAELCRMPGPNTCPDGLICGSLDIDGFGVCI